MTATCQIVMKKLPDVLMIPAAAVIEAGGKFNCWVVTDTRSNAGHSCWARVMTRWWRSRTVYSEVRPLW